MSNFCILVNFNSNIFEAEIVANKAVARLNEIMNFSEDELFDIRLVYHELITNAIIHGNNNDTKKKVELTIYVDGNNILSTIKDEGRGFDGNGWLATVRREHDPFLESGRGLLMVSALVDSLSFSEEGNEVDFSYSIRRNSHVLYGHERNEVGFV